MNWINVVILVLFIVINAIIAYRFGKAVGIAMLLYTMPSETINEWAKELGELGKKFKEHGMTPVEKFKFQIILKFCIKEFVLW